MMKTFNARTALDVRKEGTATIAINEFFCDQSYQVLINTGAELDWLIDELIKMREER
jgi:hypothetical protein